MRIDTKYILSKKINSKSSIHFRANAGFGLPYGNSTTALPYDYSFSVGGANDNRGWNARSLGPGNYKFHLDPDRTITQIGDVRLGGSIEYRFSLSEIFKGAVFTDFGNIWTYKNDSRDAKFSANAVFKELALASGVGLRLDLDYFIIRLDLGMPIYNPAYSDGARWVFQDMRERTTYINKKLLMLEWILTYYQDRLFHAYTLASVIPSNYEIIFIPFVFAGLSSCMKTEPADLVVFNAEIHTMNENNDVAQAIAIRDGKIIEFGPMIVKYLTSMLMRVQLMQEESKFIQDLLMLMDI